MLKIKYLILLFLFGCSSATSQITSETGSGFKGRIPSHDREEDLTIPFPSGAIQPIGYVAPKEVREALRKKGEKIAKQHGIKKPSDCFSEDMEGYYTYCFIVRAEKKMKDLPSNSPLRNLSVEEMAAISWFADFGYQPYNSALWAKDAKALRENEAEIKLTLSGLNKLPPEYLRVVRCDLGDSSAQVSDAEIRKVAERYKSDETSTIRGFWSTSLGTSPEFKKQWEEPCYVFLNINLKGAGAYIADLSSRVTEQEVLVRPSTQFVVGKKSEGTKNGKPYFEIELSEKVQ